MLTRVGKFVHVNVVLRAKLELRRLLAPCAALILAGVPHPAAAQNYLTSTGSPAFSAPEPVELGSVDASNGDLHLSIPLGSYPQRGTGQPQPITFEYDSNIWLPYAGLLTTTWNPFNGPGGRLGGWYLSYDAEGVYQFELYVPLQGCWSDYYWTDENGTAHVFHLNISSNTGCPTSGTAYASDSSGYYLSYNLLISNTPDIYAPDGTYIYSYSSQDPNGNYILRKDSNGNYLSGNNVISPGVVVDTLGRQIASGQARYQDSPITVSTSQGTAQYSFTTATVSVNTNFQQSGIGETSTQITVLRSLTLPDGAGSTYYFTYDCDVTTSSACSSPHGHTAYYGELTGITLPTGGTISYSYQTFKDDYGNMSEWAYTRSSANGYWTYAPHASNTCNSSQYGSSCQQTTTVSSPTGTTVYTFQLDNGAWPMTIVKKDLSSNVLSTVTNTWDFSQACAFINCHGNSFIRLLSQQTTIPSAGGNLKKQTSYTYDNPNYGNKTAINEWRYIPSANSFASTPDRATDISYLYYTSTNNINRPHIVTLYNGIGTLVSQTTYTYDQYGSNGLTAISGIAQHDDTNFGSGNLYRGNPTSISKWVSSSINPITTSYNYDTTGQVLSATDPANNTTYFCYGSSIGICTAGENFVTDTGNGNTPSPYTPAHPTNAYPISVTDAVGTQTASYYWGSGKTAVFTDYNSHSTTSHYADGLNRQTEEIDPIGWSLATYSSATQSDMYTAVADTSPSAGCSSCQHTQTILNSWGQTVKSLLVNPPPSCSASTEVDSTYDAVGRLWTQTHPYCGSGDPNNVVETFFYDALDRQTSVVHPDNEGTQVAFGANVGTLAGLTSQQGSPSTYGYGYPQVTQDESGNLRQQWLDGFGRVIEVDEPNPSAPPGAMVTISGTEQSYYYQPLGITIWDTGGVTLTVNSRQYPVTYGQSSTANSVASSIVSAIANDSGAQVTASSSGGSITLLGKTSGSYSFSFSEYTNFPQDFSHPSFSGTPASGSLSGNFESLTDSPLVTNYLYDAADHLTQVIQGVQTRTFAYDGIGRKISENTPEGGTVNYSYNVSGSGLCSGDPSNVCSRTDARGVVSTYAYDTANRLAAIAYPTIPSGVSPMPSVCTSGSGASGRVCNTYGTTVPNIGLLKQMADATGSESYTYDNDGRMTQLSKVVSGQTYNIGYQYNAGGGVTQITYPSGRVVQQSYFAAGSLCEIAATVSSCGDSTYYAGSYSYNAPGKLLGFTYGNGVGATFAYSPTRTQLTSLKYAKGGSNIFNLQYSYQQTSPYSPNCSTATALNNGSIQCITDVLAASRNANYTYDPLGRMIAENTAGSSPYAKWGLAQTYDRWGNRLSQTVTAGSGPNVSLSFNNNNQPIAGDGYTFDASGNMTVEPQPPPNDMTYDGENRMTAISGGSAGSYTYDGNGLRVVKSSGGTTTVSIFSGSSVIAEYDNGVLPSAPSREYIQGPVGLLAMLSGGATTYYHQDHLSVRLTTDVNGNKLTEEGTYPFGEQWYIGTANKWFFTNYNRDSESGLDYALARYYDSRTGTFCSADPLAGSPDDPQSWNRYPYGRNDPIDITDPSGQHWWNWLLLGGAIAGDVLTGGALTDAVEATFPNGIQIGIDAAELAASAAATGSAVRGVWHDTFSIPYGGLNNGIQTAAGLPTMADAVNPAMDAQEGRPPQLTPGSKQQYWDSFAEGFAAAQRALKKKKCAKFFGGVGPQTMDSTVYRFLPQDPTTGAWTMDVNSVAINSMGPYTRFDPNAFYFGQRWDRSQFRGLLLLHELGHQLSNITGFVPDAGPNLLKINLKHTNEVMKNCF